MSATPVSHVEFNVQRHALDLEAPTLAGIDRGCSLTKMVFTAKDDPDPTSTYVTLHCVAFRNSEFEGGLHFLRERARLPAEGKIRVTGAGGYKFRALVEAVLGLELDFVEEVLTMFRGVHFLVTHSPDTAALFYPQPEPEPDVNDSEPEGLFPCIYTVLGSGSLSMVVTADGRARVVSVTMLAGKSLLALGRALAGTVDYDELEELALRGDSRRLAATSAELRPDEDSSSPYDQLLTAGAQFPFAKLSGDGVESVDACGLEDRAAAVVDLIGQASAENVLAGLAREGLKRAIIGGHGVAGEAMRRAMVRRCAALGQDGVELKFLRTGCTGAIGAMVTRNADLRKHMLL